MRNSGVLVSLIIFHGVFLISPVIYLLGFRAAVVIPGTLLLLLLVTAIHDRKIPAWTLVVVLASLITSCVSGAYWGSWKAALYPAYFGVSLLTVAIAEKQELQRVVRWSSWLLVILLVGAWLAAFLAMTGVQPLDTMLAPQGRVHYLYYTTLTPVVVGDFIRPAGLYDEPGAFSLVVCVCAFLRHVMDMNRKTTWVMLALGFITFSLAHLIYVSIHFLAERRIAVAWANLLVVSSLAIWLLMSIGLWERFDARLIARLTVSAGSERVIAGDNRTEGIRNAAMILSDGGMKAFLFGVDVSCIESAQECKAKYPGMGINPLTPLAGDGFLVSWMYYAFLMFSVGIGVLRRTWWPLLGVGLLFMQRPSVLSAGYAMLAALTVVVALRYLVMSEGLPVDLRRILSMSRVAASARM